MKKVSVKCAWRKLLALVVVSLGLSASVYCPNSSAHVITSSLKACQWLRKNSLQPSANNRRIFAQAHRLSGTNTDIYLDV
ncbi:hypothetical protein HFU84_04425 [Acidithiobacillus sp. CV18-2]|uniref:Secreted protein n=1 Tax=Igneacidithiobacillus copahuensis TaxID=2724909 RepID=A0AAE3CKV9_9PROT|nr:hypothetical protein [Igneacidithiobacillus copahuensis]MBU2754181.1 hypothetical protein [Acidithiobacillus sp. CV18-3]MBU2758489.1 hypothetical protein [Acidithiobacillus sp. BN09-2]MBU2776761.1 hypothetical protein [Acidithiobacillus sp. CV18-2]MBU2797086.1 hypothetical protein [Acidithiobacillus sp. VAN18-2]MBU2798466.1 hypothetical protein [Acidithiobacillus sp. VAN18-4]UTV80154.1 hypothetical protein MQE22_08970 [Acidithiobacillus sp. YTS05]